MCGEVKGFVPGHIAVLFSFETHGPLLKAMTPSGVSQRREGRPCSALHQRSGVTVSPHHEVGGLRTTRRSPPTEAEARGEGPVGPPAALPGAAPSLDPASPRGPHSDLRAAGIPVSLPWALASRGGHGCAQSPSREFNESDFPVITSENLRPFCEAFSI